MSRLWMTAGIVWASLREIFDEAAYERFLRRSRMIRSTESYAAFREELDEARTRRPKCC